MRVRLMLALIVGTLALIVMGCMHIAEGLNNRTPKVITYDALVSSRPSDGWYSVTDGYLSVAEGVYTYSKGSSESNANITELYVPLRSFAELEKLAKKQTPPVNVLVTTQDPNILSTFNKLKDATEAQANQIPATDLVVERNVNGMIASSLHSISDEDDKALREGMPGLAPDSIIINDNTHPSPGMGVAMLLGGLVLAAFQILYRLSRFRTSRV